ncbi:maestro heat-like repeat-containing protein family member 1 [Phymastichus coffea]|uniref:maestro heat-like repeat-containing protein family member 1 n=1 Tax=Phymastichus coffea TaxID=108790 RepID=UPI00273B1511|nr:maestro heat-like repeat-containing protein family member 1 [Phymastichus coffea]
MKDEDEANNSKSELSAVVGALLDTLNDKDETVNLSAIESIRKISQKNPVLVIHAAVYFWEMHRKMSETHLIAILKMMTEVCQNYIKNLEDTLATTVADLALVELTGHASEQALQLIVALSKTQCSQAVGALIIKFETNVTPYYAIIQALGMIAEKNSVGILPFIKVTLSVLVPLLHDMHDDKLKLASTFTLGKLADAISDCLTNVEVINNTSLSKDIFYDELSIAFDILIYTWLRTSKNLNLTEYILTSLASILALFPNAYDEKVISKLTPTLLNLCKKPTTRLAAVRVLSLILTASTDDVKELLKPHLEQIHQVLSEIVSISPFDVTRDVLLAHYEVLQCFRAIVLLYPEEALEKTLQQLKCANSNQRSRSLVVLRHLINTLPPEDESALQRIALSLQDSLGDGSTRQVIGAIVALAARPTFPLLPSQRTSFIKFMVLHCGSKSEEGEACEEALHLLSSTVDGAEIWLWPSLIKALMDQTYVASAVPILRALSPLAVKIIRDENNLSNEKDFQSIKVFGRCLELLEDDKKRLAVVTFLRCAAPLLGYQLKPQWDTKLLKLSKFLEQNTETLIDAEKILIWEERMVEFLEESVALEGDAWALRLAEELVKKTITPSLSIFIAAVASSAAHITLLIDLARTHSVNATGQSPVAGEYARAVGICAKHHLETVLSLIEEFCHVEDARKQPVRLLGLVKDTKAAATNEAAKAGLLKSYAEITRRGDAAILFPALEKHIFPWIIRQLNDCKEISTKGAGLIAIEQGAGAVHPNRLAGSTGFRVRGSALATLLTLLQSTAGYRPLQLYPLILKAIIALLKVPPALTDDEKVVLLETTMDKIIAASSEIAAMKMPQVMQQVIEGLGTISSETVVDSADTLAVLVDILLPWMQSKSSAERRTTLLVLRTTLRSYHDSLKYTYPGGKLEPGKLLGRFLAWSADPDLALRPLVVDCVSLALNIGARHRSSVPDNLNHLNQDLSESKRVIVSEDTKTMYEGVKSLATSACERVAGGELVSLAEGLVEGLLCRGEGGVAAGIALTELFKIRGFDIPRANLYLIDSIIAQMRQMENASCKKTAAAAVRALSTYHLQEVVEHLLHQPLPLDRGSKECWKELGKADDIGSQTLELLLKKLDNDNLLVDTNSPTNKRDADNSKRPTAVFSSLAAIVATGQLLSSSIPEDLIKRQLSELLAVLLKYLAGWLHADPPMSIVSTKFGFVPNRETCKIVPHQEVYNVLVKILNIISIQEDPNLSTETAFEAECDAEENLVATVHTVVQCLSKRANVLENLARHLGKLAMSTLPAQRVVAVAFYSELIGKVNCDVVWLDAIINTLHEAKADSFSLVRKLSTIGLTRVAYLDSKQVDEYFDSCLASLLNGLEEPLNAEGNNEVVLESLRGLSVILTVKTEKPISPRVVFTLRTFVEKDSWEMRLAAISALGAVVRSWQRFVLSPDDDVTDHLLSCIPCLTIKLEDNVHAVVTAARQVLYDSAYLMQCKSLAHILNTHLAPNSSLSIESFLRELINCMKTDLPQKAEELRNAVVRGYSRSENPVIRATSALILGLFGDPRPEDVQRMLQLLRDKENFVRARAARALALCFTL